jgi:drug/metabolite transporter (DMT)-like permease
MGIMNKSIQGWANGLAGVVVFSGSLPATRVAVQAFDPFFLTFARASIAGVLGALLLLATRQPLPRGRDFGSLLVVVLGVVLGYPLLSGMALRHIPSAQGALFTGLLPLGTAVCGMLLAGERLPLGFWLCSIAGSATVLLFALTHGAGALSVGDELMLAAVVVCAFGYAEGARLARRLGGLQVITWAQVLALPVMAPLAWWTHPAGLASVGVGPWMGLAYVALFSSLIGFVFWYRGLALGGIAAVGQIQLLQPLLGLLAAAAVLGEALPQGLIAATLIVIACVALGRRLTLQSAKNSPSRSSRKLVPCSQEQ